MCVYSLLQKLYKILILINNFKFFYSKVNCLSLILLNLKFLNRSLLKAYTLGL